jgi:carbon monoxide dehydrogenase subunit G
MNHVFHSAERRIDMQLKNSVTVNRPIQSVFDYASNPENVPTWQAQIMDVRKTSSGPLGEGTTAVAKVKFLGVQFEVPTETTAWDPPRSFSVQNTGGPMPMSMQFTFTPEDQATRIDHLADMELSGLYKIAGPLLEPVVQRQMQTNLGALKAVLES